MRDFSEDLHNELAQMDGDDLAALTVNSECVHEIAAAEAILDGRDVAAAEWAKAMTAALNAAMKARAAGLPDPEGYDWDDIISTINSDWRAA